MKRIITKAHTCESTGRSPQLRRRRGSVQIELALFLPLYASILMVLPTLSSFARTHQNVVVNARHDAWLKQSEYGEATERLENSPSNLEVLGQVLLEQQDPSSGVVSGQNEGKGSIYLKALDVAVDTQSEHFVLTDPWDYRVLEFEDQQNHPRLMMGERLTFVGNINRGAFAELTLKAGAAAQDASQKLAKIGNQRGKAEQEATKAEKAVNRLIDQAEADIEEIQNNLVSAENRIPVDVNLVNSLNRQLRSTQQELKELRENLQELEKMNKALRSVL